MNKSLLLFVLLLTFSTSGSSQTFIDHKGTKVIIDTSKWGWNNSDITNKNNGNVSIGSNTPRCRLDVSGYIKLGSSDFTSDFMVSTISERTGMIRYSAPAKSLQYHDDTIWHTLAIAMYGDIKSSFTTNDHNGWVLLNGRAISALSSTQQTRAMELGFTSNLPDAGNAFLVDNGAAAGTVSGSNTRMISRANLPNVNLTGGTSGDGAHSHDIQIMQNSEGKATGDYNYYTPTVSGNTAVTVTTASGGDHSHTVSIPLNGNVTQTDLDITPKSLAVKMFVYLGL